jgi:hypothetical protein
VSEKSLEIRQFQAFENMEEPGVAPSWLPGVARDGRYGNNGSDGSGWVYNHPGLGSQNGNSG